MTVQRNEDLTYTFTCDGCGATIDARPSLMHGAAEATAAGWDVRGTLRQTPLDACPACRAKPTEAAP